VRRRTRGLSGSPAEHEERLTSAIGRWQEVLRKGRSCDNAIGALVAATEVATEARNDPYTMHGQRFGRWLDEIDLAAGYVKRACGCQR